MSSNLLFFFLCSSSSNFGIKLVMSLKGKLVTAKEVLDAGPQPHSTMETIIITLMHLAMYSEKMELEVLVLFLFFLCIIGKLIKDFVRKYVLQILETTKALLNKRKMNA